MDLILISCCKSKRLEGAIDPIRTRQDQTLLTSSSIEKLHHARAELIASGISGLPFGDKLPAYQRYQGVVYHTSQLEKCYPNRKNYRLVILSAFYGLLEGGQLIQNYNIHMKSKIKGTSLKVWWKRKGLSLVLSDYIQNMQPARIFNLLANDYKEALSPWPPDSLLGRITTVPVGRGYQADQQRGKYLRNLICDKQNEQG